MRILSVLHTILSKSNWLHYIAFTFYLGVLQWLPLWILYIVSFPVNSACHRYDSHRLNFLRVTRMLRLSGCGTLHPTALAPETCHSPGCRLFRPLCPSPWCPVTHLSPSDDQKVPSSPCLSLSCPVATPDATRIPSATFSWCPRFLSLPFQAGRRVNRAQPILCLSFPSCCFICTYCPPSLPPASLRQIHCSYPWHLLRSWPALMLRPLTILCPQWAVWNTTGVWIFWRPVLLWVSLWPFIISPCHACDMLFPF